MNIGITCYPTVGGSGAIAAELGKQLATRGHEVHFVSWRLPFRLGDFQKNIRFHEVDVSSYPLFEYPPHDLSLAAKMAEVSRENRLDVLHVLGPTVDVQFVGNETTGIDCGACVDACPVGAIHA